MTLPVITTSYGSDDQTYNIIPCIGWGKYVQEDDKYKMTMRIKVSHAFIDGKPLADAFNNIQDSINKLSFMK